MTGADLISSMASMGVEDEASGQAHHPEDDHADQPDEGARDEGEGLEKSLS